MIESPTMKAVAMIQSGGLNHATPPAAADDVALFQAAMAPPSEVETAVFLAPAPAPAGAPTAPPSLGQAILDGMDSVRNQFDSATTGIRHVLESTASDLTIRDMLSIQMQISTLSIQQDLMGKIVGKTTQNVDQLLKAQ